MILNLKVKIAKQPLFIVSRERKGCEMNFLISLSILIFTCLNYRPKVLKNAGVLLDYKSECSIEKKADVF